MIGIVYGLMGVGLNIIFGIMDVVNMAHGEIYMVGALFLILVMGGIIPNYFAALFVTIVISFLLGALVYLGIVKPLVGKPLLSSALAMIGLSIFLENIVIALYGPKPVDIRFPIGGVKEIGGLRVTNELLTIVGITLVTYAILYVFLYRTDFGTAIRATVQNRDAAALVGVNVSKIYLFTFSLGCMLTAASGALLGTMYLFYPVMGGSAILKSFTIVILGGMGSVEGAVAGGLLLGLVEILGASYISFAYKDAFGLAIAIIILLIRPQGLFGRG